MSDSLVRQLRLYLVTDAAVFGARGVEDTVAAAVRGGVSCVQLREKQASTRDFLSQACALRTLLSPLGIALVNKPAILLLDEPTTGLDPNARREIWDILRRLKEASGTSMILTTH